MKKINLVLWFMLATLLGSNMGYNNERKITNLSSVNDQYTEVRTRADLEDIKNNESGNYILMNDIDLSNTNWEPITLFSGHFNGNGYSIKNMKINVESDNYYYTGYSCYYNKGVGYVSPTCLGLFGITTELAIIDNITVTGEINFNAPSRDIVASGGLVGYSLGTITNSKSDVKTVIKTDMGIRAGGLAGMAFANVSNSHATGSINVESSSDDYLMIGGLIGSGSKSSVVNAYSTGNVTIGNSPKSPYQSSTAYAGGLVGNFSGSILRSFSIGNVNVELNSFKATTYAGGLVAELQGEVSYSYSSGSVTSVANSNSVSVAYAGGLIAKLAGTTITSRGEISNSYSIGNVESITTITRTTSSPSSIYSHGYSGGLVGYCFGSVTNSYATGDTNTVSNEYGIFRSGPLSGYHSGNITNAYATGNTSAISLDNNARTYAGTLVGEYESVVFMYIVNSYGTSGSVIGKTISNVRLSGLVADNITLYFIEYVLRWNITTLWVKDEWNINLFHQKGIKLDIFNPTANIKTGEYVFEGQKIIVTTPFYKKAEIEQNGNRLLLTRVASDSSSNKNTLLIPMGMIGDVNLIVSTKGGNELVISIGINISNPQSKPVINIKNNEIIYVQGTNFVGIESNYEITNSQNGNTTVVTNFHINMLDEIGSHIIVIEATDEIGNTDTKQFVLNVYSAEGVEDKSDTNSSPITMVAIVGTVSTISVLAFFIFKKIKN